MSEAEGEAQIAELFCVRHEERRAEARCARCNEPACLECAVPVRGEVLCIVCATRELGPDVATIPAPVGTTPRGAHRAALGLFAVGLAMAFVPWHRFGILTSVGSAWGFESGPLPPLAGVAIGAGAALALVALRSRRSRRRTAIGYVVLGFFAALAATVSVLAEPAYVSPSPAPFVASVASLGAAGAGVMGLRRARAKGPGRKGRTSRRPSP